MMEWTYILLVLGLFVALPIITIVKVRIWILDIRDTNQLTY